MKGSVANLAATGALSGRGVRIVDSTQKSFDTFTDMAGNFSVDGVVPPYAVNVVADSLGMAVAYLGLSTPTPTLFGFGADAGSFSATVALTLALPSCGAAGCQYYVTPAVNGSGGADGASLVYPSGTSVPVSVPVSWSGSNDASATLRILVADPTLSNFWYAEVSTTVSDRSSVSLGTITPAYVSTAATIDLSAATYGLTSSWTNRGAAIILAYPGEDGYAYLANESTSTASAGIPAIAGATIHTVAQADSPASLAPDAGTAIQQAAGGTAYQLPLTTTASSLAIYPPARWTNPTTSGAALESTASLSWVPYAGAPASIDWVTFASTTAIGSGTYVFTASPSLSFETLASLGLPLTAGDYELALNEYRVGATLDALVGSGQLMPVLTGQSATLSGLAESQLKFTVGP